MIGDIYHGADEWRRCPYCGQRTDFPTDDPDSDPSESVCTTRGCPMGRVIDGVAEHSMEER